MSVSELLAKIFNGDNLHEMSILFSGKNKKNINLSSAELAKRVVTVKCIQSEFEVLHNIYLFKNFLPKFVL